MTVAKLGHVYGNGHVHDHSNGHGYGNGIGNDNGIGHVTSPWQWRYFHCIYQNIKNPKIQFLSTSEFLKRSKIVSK